VFNALIFYFLLHLFSRPLLPIAFWCCRWLYIVYIESKILIILRSRIVWVAIMKRMMVNNSININKTKRHLSYQSIKHTKTVAYTVRRLKSRSWKKIYWIFVLFCLSTSVESFFLRFVCYIYFLCNFGISYLATRCAIHMWVELLLLYKTRQ
jgi:hypothetical protein